MGGEFKAVEKEEEKNKPSRGQQYTMSHYILGCNIEGKFNRNGAAALLGMRTVILRYGISVQLFVK